MATIAPRHSEKHTLPELSGKNLKRLVLLVIALLGTSHILSPNGDVEPRQHISSFSPLVGSGELECTESNIGVWNNYLSSREQYPADGRGMLAISAVMSAPLLNGDQITVAQVREQMVRGLNDGTISEVDIAESAQNFIAGCDVSESAR